SSDSGSGSDPSTKRIHPCSRPRPLGLPTAKPAVAGSSRMSKRSMIGADLWNFSLASAASMHSSGGGSCGGVAVVATSSGSSPRRSEEHTSELQSRFDLVCRLLLEKKKHNTDPSTRER